MANPGKTTLKNPSLIKVLNIFDSFQHSIKIVTKSSILDIIAAFNPTLLLRVLSQFSLHIQIGQSILLTKKMALY